jgi:hypothetical protein
MQHISLPGYKNCIVTTDGQVFNNGKLKKPLFKKGQTAMLRLKENGITRELSLSKLVAQCFVPNPHRYKHVQFKDGNRHNCRADNLEWVNGNACKRHWPGQPGPLRLKPTLGNGWIDPERVPLEDFPGYYISPAGLVYKENRLLLPRKKKQEALSVRLQVPGSYPARHREFGLAKLVASHFIPNPRQYGHVIFKDRNNRHCHKDNLAWVDGETFAYYSGVRSVCNKIMGDAHTAAKTCCNEWLRYYYQSQDVYWLHRCWQDIDKRLRGHPQWKDLQGEIYLYFFDRASRFSILGEPRGLVIKYLKGLQIKQKKELSPDIPYGLLMQADESLRNIGDYMFGD